MKTTRKPFHASVWHAPDGRLDYILHCRKCGTRELCWGDKPHDVAATHAKFWHAGGGPKIPVGWANPR